MHRPPFQLGHLLDCLGCEFRRRDVDEHVGAGALQLDDMGIDRGLAGLVALLGDQNAGRLVAEHFLQAGHVVLAEIVIGIEHRDFCIRPCLQNILREDSRLDAVARLKTHGPGKILRIVPLAGAGGKEQLRDFLRVVILLYRGLGRSTQRVEHQKHLVAFDQLAHLLHRLRRAVAVVVTDEVDLAAVDAALVVDHPEIGILGLADDAVGGSRAAIGFDIADLDFGVGGAGVVLLLGEGCLGSEKREGGSSGDGNQVRSERGAFLVFHDKCLFLIGDLSAVGWSITTRRSWYRWFWGNRIAGARSAGDLAGGVARQARRRSLARSMMAGFFGVRPK